MKKKIAFIAIGQAGGNIGQLFEERGFSVLYLNTSEEDLSTLSGAKYKYHITGGEGCNKDRKKAKQLVIDDYDQIAAEIDAKLDAEIIFVIFASGGGTGSGAGPMLCDLLLDDGKTVGAVTVIPALDESTKSHVNSYECFAELTKIEGLASCFILDNENGNKLGLNRSFADDFTAFVEIGLTVAMTALLDHQNEYVENTKAAVEEQQKNIDSLHEEIEARKASNSETEATVATISSLKSQLIDLNGKEKLSNQDKAEMVSIVAQLNELLPDMNLSINEQTGYLEQNNSELEDLIENQTEYLELQAAQEEQAEIIKQITKAKINLNKATSEQAELESDLAEKQEEYNQGMIEGTIPAYGDLYQEIAEAQKAVAEYDDQITESQAILDDLQGDYEVATDMINQYKESMNQASDAVNSTNANTIEYGSKTYEVSEEVKASFDEINAAYRMASEEALSSISSQVSLFDELSSKSDMTVQQMSANLQSQTDTFNQYSEDLKTASQMMKEDTTGSFSTIVQSIMDMGVEGAGYLHELVTAAEDSTESFDEVMNSFAEMEEARQTLADTMGDINVGYSDAVNQMISSTSDGLDSISNAFVDKSPEMRVSSAYMCDQIYDQMKTSIGMTDDGSSIVFQGTGNSIAKGVADGISAGQPTINTALQRAIDNAVANANFSGISAKIDRMLGDQLK